MSELITKLFEYSQNGRIPFHMPGHKRNISSFNYLKNLGGNADITEISGFDDLHNPNGIIKKTEDNLAKIFGGSRAFLLVNGSTCGIMAGISSATHYGDKIIMARNCHKSVYNAVCLLGLKPVYIMPKYSKEFGIYGSISENTIKDALNENSDAKLVVLTSPTYEGVISDIASICTAAHNKNIPVLVDQAHGAHLGFFDEDIKSAVSCGADITVLGLHKTLPCLTQTAATVLQGQLIDQNSFEYYLSSFETSSPSYLLMASVDGCADSIINGSLSFEKWKDIIDDFYESTLLKKLNFLIENPAFFALDKTKIVVFTSGTNINGAKLAQILRHNYNIECEMAYADYVIFMTGAGTTKSDLNLLAKALVEIDENISLSQHTNDEFVITHIPRSLLTSGESAKHRSKTVMITDSLNKISADFVWAYPPGIPIIVPGEIIDNHCIEVITRLINCGTQLTIPYSNRSVSDGIRIIADNVQNS